MKHLLSLISCCLFSLCVFSQHLDTLTVSPFTNGAFQPETRSINSYNSSCLVDSTVSQQFLTNSQWRNVAKIIFTYTDTLISSETVQSWDTTSSTWQNALRLIHSYTGTQLDTLLTQVWDATSSTWTDLSRIINSYNANNLLDSTLTETNVLGAWQSASLTVNHYNVSNLLDTSTIQAPISINSSRTITTYNGDKTVKETINQTWDLVSTSWTNETRHAYTYNTSKLELTDTTQNWNISVWADTLLTINTYTGTALATSLDQRFDNSSSTFVNVSRSNYNYNGDGTIATITTQVRNKANTVWLNSSKITFHYTATCGALPLTLLDFTAALNGKAAQLQWTTSAEINTKNFIVQRSIDAIHFQNIGAVNAVGHSTQKTSYQFADAGAVNTGANKVYYRLQMVDQNGKFTYSKIAAITIVNGKLFVIYPNPVKDQLLITANASLNNSQVRITDQSGKVILSQQIANMQAGTPNKINVASLNKGVYYLQLITGSDVQTTKFLKY